MMHTGLPNAYNQMNAHMYLWKEREDYSIYSEEDVWGHHYFHVHSDTWSMEMFYRLREDIEKVKEHMADWGQERLYHVAAPNKYRLPELFGFRCLEEYPGGVRLYVTETAKCVVQ